MLVVTFVGGVCVCVCVWVHVRVYVCSSTNMQNKNKNTGRLDFNTQGLLLLTNSGLVANTLENPRHELQRQYVACVRGKVRAFVRIVRFVR